MEHGGTEEVGGTGVAAGVHEHEGVALPFAFADVAVAGDAGRGVDYGGALAEDSVEEGRFADVGPADQGDQWFHGSGIVVCVRWFAVCRWPPWWPGIEYRNLQN